MIATAPEPILPEELVEETALWLQALQLTYHEEVPVKLHSHSFDAGGTPEFHPQFLSFIERDCRKPGCHDLACRHGQDREDPRKRTHKSLRKLRKIAPREFDALYLMVAHGHSMHDVARAMTERAVRLGKPERYSEGAVLILVASAIDKVQNWW